MNFQEEFNRGNAGQGLPDDPHALTAWNAGARAREENERVARANAANANDLSVGVPPFESQPATAAATTAHAPADALSAVKSLLGLGAFVVFAPITLPAAAATLFAAPLLVAFSVPRPSPRRAIGAAFLGLLAYFAIVAGTLAPMFPAQALDRITSMDALIRLLAPRLGTIVLFQLAAVVGCAVVAAWRLADGLPQLRSVVRAGVAGVGGLLMFAAGLSASAWSLGARL